MESPDAEHPNIAGRDSRLRAIATLTTEQRSPSTGAVYPLGARVELCGFVRFRRNLVRIPVPDPAAVCISLARRLGSQGAAFFRLRLDAQCVRSAQGHRHFALVGEAELFDAYEDLIACVVFSHAALEVFANDKIPDDFQLSPDRVKKCKVECRSPRSKDEIERWVSLDNKLKHLLPAICSVQPPSGRAWQRYADLKRLRDRLVHLKSTDWKRSVPENADDWLWTRMMSGEAAEAPEIALDVISHYYPDTQQRPRWLRKLTPPGGQEASEPGRQALDRGCTYV